LFHSSFLHLSYPARVSSPYSTFLPPSPRCSPPPPQQSLKQVSGLRPVSRWLPLHSLSVTPQNFSIDKTHIDFLLEEDCN
jgi:hypothetical protein